VEFDNRVALVAGGTGALGSAVTLELFLWRWLCGCADGSAKQQEEENNFNASRSTSKGQFAPQPQHWLTSPP
jgi:hypothetical protein